MTEDVLDVTSSSTNTVSDSKIMSEQTPSDNFLKPISLKNSKVQAKRKLGSVKNKDSAHSESKKRKKQKLKSTNQNKGDVEDATESVDSGCIADIAGDVTDWPQVEAAVLEERNYILSLLKWLPDFQWKLPVLKPPKPSAKDKDEPDNEVSGEERSTDKKTRKKKKKTEPFITRGKVLNEADEIDSLREKYREMLAEMKKNRKSNCSKKSVKKEGKLLKKLKNVDRRNKKNQNRQRKLEQAEIFKVKHKELEKKKVLQHRKIFNESGKLVFSKFDFSSDGLHSRKAKNLEYKVTQAIKEREMRKRLQKEGNLKAAAEMKEIEAWSSALQRADGVKVRDDLDLLQKSLKKKEHRKKQSKKRWDERTAALEKKMNDRQQKRQDNVNARKEKKFQNKGKKMQQKGHVVPGF